MKLSILVTTGIESENVHTVRQIAEAALRQGHAVSLFLMDEGVDVQGHLRPLVERGAQLTICGHNAHERGLPRVEEVVFGSQYDWANALHDADRVIAFG